MPASVSGSALLSACWGVFPVNNIIKSCGLAAAVVSLSACATVTRGTKETFKIQTTPTAAAVSLSSGETCTSPCALKLKRKLEFTVTANKPGYKTATARVKSKVKGGGIAGGAGNILLGGVIGAVVDGSNGAMRDLTPNPLIMTLEPEMAPAAMNEPTAVPSVEPAPVAQAVAETAPVAEAAPAPGGE